MESAETRHAETEETLRTQNQTLTTQLKDSQANKSQFKQENEAVMTARIKKNEAELKSQKTLIEELEAKVKESYEAQMQVTHNSRKDIAMRDQQIEFLTMQLKETKEQLEESQRQH